MTDRRHPRGPELNLSLVVTLGAGVGLVVGLLTASFVLAIFALNDWLLISPRARMMFEHRAWLAAAAVAVPTLGGLVVGLLHRFIAEGRPHGPPDVIAAVQTRQGRLPLRPGLLSAVSSLVSLGAGASVGQYGPLVHMGGTLGSLGARLLRAGRSDDNIAIACGVAAAIATAFKAPLAGILFAHEVVLRHFALRAFAPVAAAAIAGYVIEDLVFERPPLFHVAAAEIVHRWEYLVFLAMGAAGALVAAAYMRAVLGAARLAPRSHIPRVLRPAAAGAVLGTAALWVPDILGIGAETLRFATIAGAIPPPELALILVAKLLATAMCLGFGFSGGVFSPALLIGALFGALCGNAVALVTGGVQATMVVYAVAGMVAVTAPVIGAPMATLLIIFELTGSYTLTTAALASVALANLTSARVFGRSLFDVQLRLRGLDLSAGRSRALLQGERIAPLVQPAPVTLAPDLPIAAAIDTLGRRGRAEGYLVDADGGYRGTVTLAALEARRGQGAAPVLDAAEAERPVVAADSSLWVAVDQARTLTGEALPVVERGGRRLVGVLPEVALSRAHVETLDAVRREEHGGG
ncbi:chloride channel protein [Thiohalocapsa halophila]